jgi:hypothetical protein
MKTDETQVTPQYDILLTAILSEYKMLRDEMQMFVGYHRRDTQLLIALLSVLVSLYLTNGSLFAVEGLALIIPTLICVYFLMQIFNLYMVSVEAKACARIENRVNALLGSTVMDWENLSRKVVRSGASPTPLATGVTLLVCVGIFVAFAIQAGMHYGTWPWIMHGVELLFMLVATLLWAWFETRGKLPE